MCANFDLYGYAISLTSHGISVIPIRTDGTKAPEGRVLPKDNEGKPTWVPFQSRIVDIDTIRSWYENHQSLGIAAIGGVISGNLEALDIDAPEFANDWRELVEKHEGGAELLKNLVIVQTPSGGFHYIYRCSMAVSGSQKLARRHGDSAVGESKIVVLFETRGEGGYFLLPGSPLGCHETGNPYLLIQGSLTNIPVITPEDREILLSCARVFDQMPAIKDCTGTTNNSTGDRPGDEFNRRATWDEVLLRHGWKSVYTRGNVTYWRRPGKKVGISATTNWKNLDRLKVFSTSTEFETETTYSRFAAFAVLNHKGDFRVAARALANTGYGKQTKLSSTSKQPPTPIPGEIEREEPDAIRKECYSSPCSQDHYLTRWIEYAGMRTDAAPEYHEAGALTLLSSATPNVRAQLAPYPKGLPTNLYVLVIGSSTISRKSTSQSFARDVQGSAIENSLCAEHFSPEGFVEQLALRPSDCTTVYVDEFGELLTKLHHAKYMAGLRGLLLTIYGGESYTYRRHSKRIKGGDTIEDFDHIEQPHLSILGATTPAIFDFLVEQDIISGLLPRFAIIMPERKPPRRPFYETGSSVEEIRNELIAWIKRLHRWATCERAPEVKFQPNVLSRLDDYAAFLENECSNPQMHESSRAMLQRLTPMTVKLAMLVAAGHPGVADGPAKLVVTLSDADAAIIVARRWQHDAMQFAARVGESDFERVLQRCLRIVRAKRLVRRGEIAKVAHVEAKKLDDVRDTLLDRELVIVNRPETGGRSGELWCCPGKQQGSST